MRPQRSRTLSTLVLRGPSMVTSATMAEVWTAVLTCQYRRCFSRGNGLVRAEPPWQANNSAVAGPLPIPSPGPHDDGDLVLATHGASPDGARQALRRAFGHLTGAARLIFPRGPLFTVRHDAGAGLKASRWRPAWLGSPRARRASGHSRPPRCSAPGRCPEHCFSVAKEMTSGLPPLGMPRKVDRNSALPIAGICQSRRIASGITA
jgi:hypothetical protein